MPRSYLSVSALVGMCMLLGALMGPATGVGSTVSSRPGYTVQPKRSWMSFEVPGKRGYSVFVTAEADTARIEAFRGDALVVYVAPVKRVENRVSARFGRLGRLAMNFNPSGSFRPSKEPQGDCRGRRAEVQKGVFEGRFRWRGEKGFSTAGTRRVRGLSVRTFREVCRGETAAIGRDEAEKSFLFARSSAFREVREVEAYGSADEGIGLVGRLVEDRARLNIERTVFAYVDDGGLQVDSEGNRRFASNYPFRGSAELRADPQRDEPWRGDLEADFPGRGYLPLAGSSFSVRAE
jgi:hypothetical protein